MATFLSSQGRTRYIRDLGSLGGTGLSMGLNCALIFLFLFSFDEVTSGDVIQCGRKLYTRNGIEHQRVRMVVVVVDFSNNRPYPDEAVEMDMGRKNAALG